MINLKNVGQKLKETSLPKFRQETDNVRDDRLLLSGFKQCFNDLKQFLKQITSQIRPSISSADSINNTKSQNELQKDLPKSQTVGGSVLGQLGHLHVERMEKRFQDVQFPVLKFSANGEEREQEIAEWIGSICKTVFSVGFNLYESGVMDINKVKAYCSQNILRNLLLTSQQNHLTWHQFQFINSLLSQDLLTYFCQKYPQSEQSETSTKFTSDLIERDGMEENQYDLIYKSKVQFGYEDTGNYNSQIMEFLNYIINLSTRVITVPDLTADSKKCEKPLNQAFANDMESFFRMVQVESNTIHMQKYQPKKQNSVAWTQDKLSTQKQKQQYQQKVSSYTNFLIGQKLSKNLKPFSQFDIKSGNLKLRSSELMRVITKWCEEIQKNFDQRTILRRENPFRMKDGSKKYLQTHKTKKLAELLQTQKKEIIKKMKTEVNKNNHKIQSELSHRKVKKQLLKFSQSEAIVGQFASQIFKNNQCYLINCLNLLIHGINKVTKEYAVIFNCGDDLVPQLISFKIGDLMRCKCSSKETEIIALYKELERRHRDPNSGFKIVRVKNRLNTGNKDILVNMQYRKQMMVQIQLAIKSDKSKFIECSYNFNHYLYQLRRAQFGPIMQMCSIWVSKDLKSKFYLDQHQKLNKRNTKKINKTSQQMNLESCCFPNQQIIKLPFQCHLCDCFYSDLGVTQQNLFCGKCKQYTCYLCQLEVSEKKREALFTKMERLKEKDIKSITIQKEIPKKGGALMRLKKSKKKAIFFVTAYQSEQYNIFEYKPQKNQLKPIQKFKSQTFTESFLKQNLVFTSPGIQQQIQALHKEAQPLITQYFMTKYLQQSKQIQKRSINLVGRNVKMEELMEVRDRLDCLPLVKRLNLSENRELGLDGIGNIVDMFPNVELAILNGIGLKQIPENMWRNLNSLHISKNSLQNPNITMLQPLPKLQQLNLSSNSLQNFPTPAQSISNIHRLKLDSNKIKQIPDEIGCLTHLEELSIVNNCVEVVGDGIGELVCLEELDLGGNRLGVVGGWVGGLTALVRLKLGNNLLSSLPQEIGNLVNLQVLILDNNQLQTLPQTITNLKSLQQLSIPKNKLVQLPPQLHKLHSLQQINLTRNLLIQIPESLFMLNSLRVVKFQVIKQFDYLKFLDVLGRIGNDTEIFIEYLVQNQGIVGRIRQAGQNSQVKINYEEI